MRKPSGGPVEYRVLGPLEVHVDGCPLRLGGPKQRALLAVLLLNANRVVPVSQLVDAVWGETPPATVAVQVQGHVSALRKLFSDAGAGDDIIVTRAAGYLIRVGAEQLDLEAFDRWASEARQVLAANRADDAAAGFARALGLWRGAALSDVVATMPAEVARLEERRLSVLEERVEADLALGRHADLVPELVALTNEHPLRERLRGQLMVALYRCGRQADALAVYRDTRTVLVEELGLEPGPELQRLERSVLAGEIPPVPQEAAPAAEQGVVSESTPPSTALAVPPAAQLPHDVADFTGRTKTVTEVFDQLAVAGEDERHRAMVVSAIAGKGGVGKTTLAVHVAHRLSPNFPDGQLYLNLRGAETDPVEPSDALVGFLHALGVDGGAIPDGLEERAALYRSRLSGRRMLILLDNAAQESQVRPLLPGSASCAVLVTSRARLVGLEGAGLFDLDVLPADEAIELLGRIAGWQRVADEPAAAERIVRLCGDLPLAVRIAGARLAARPHWRLDRLAGVLADERRRLDELRVGDLEVRASLSLSYAGLEPTARRAFRRLGLLDAPDFASWVVAALLDVSRPEAEPVVDDLVDAQLLEVADRDAVGHGRYRLHDLLRVYARERAHAEDTATERDGALSRALGGWLALAEWACRAMEGNASWIQHGNAPRWRLDQSAAEELVSEPFGWFEAERLPLIAAVEQAGSAELGALTWDLANSVAFFLEARGYFSDWRHTHEVALATAQRAEDRRGAAVMLRGLSEVHTYQDRYDEALDCLEQARLGFGAVNDRDGEADVHCGFGLVYRLQGRSEDSLHAFERALTLLSDVGDRPDRAYALLGVGTGHLEQDRPDEAEEYLGQALACFRASGFRRGEAHALHRLGRLHRAQRRFDDAMRVLREAMAIYAELGERHANAYALLALGLTHTDQAQPQQAESMLERALETFRELGDRFGEARALHSLGELHRGDHRPDLAVACLAESVRIWSDLDLTARRAAVLSSLGEAHAAGGDHESARTCWSQALRLFRDLDAPEAEELAHRLGE